MTFCNSKVSIILIILPKMRLQNPTLKIPEKDVASASHELFHEIHDVDAWHHWDVIMQLSDHAHTRIIIHMHSAASRFVMIMCFEAKLVTKYNECYSHGFGVFASGT